MKLVTVVGSGIVGLTSATLLQEAGFKVKIITKEQYDKTLSSKVGAIWFPFEVHPKENANKWATLAYKRYQKEEKEGNGISFIPFMTAYSPESNTDWTKQLPTGAVRKAVQSELPNGMQMAHISMVPLAEPQKYLPHLFDQFLANGGVFSVDEISSMQELHSLGDWVINCTGLGAKKLCSDHDLHPMRGQIIRSTKLNVHSFADSTKRGGLSYVINRSEDSIIGGTDYENDWNEKIDPADSDLILKRLRNTGLLQEPEILEVMVGLRPLRSTVRFEFDKEYPNVFHNYGHGGAGFTIAWGCAIELVEVLSKK